MRFAQAPEAMQLGPMQPGADPGNEQAANEDWDAMEGNEQAASDNATGADAGNEQAADEDWDASEDDERVANEAPVAQTLPVIKVHKRISLLTTEAQQMLIGRQGAVLSARRRTGAADHPDGEGGAWSSRPMAQPLMTAEFVHGQDGLGDAGVPASTREPAGTLGAAEIVRLARSRPGELTLVAVGPLTNIGLALLLEPRLPELVDRVVIMGGAIGVPGNASETGEANVWHDPEAAQLVLDAPWDVVLVGLEITMQTQLSAESLQCIERSTDPRAQLTWRLIQHYLDVYEGVLGERTCVLHDPLAMALALEPELATYRLVRAVMELRGERSRGQAWRISAPGSLRPPIRPSRAWCGSSTASTQPHSTSVS